MSTDVVMESLLVALLAASYAGVGAVVGYRAMSAEYADCRRKGIKLEAAHSLARGAAFQAWVCWPLILAKYVYERAWTRVQHKAERASWSQQELQAKRISELEREIKRYEEDV